MNRALISILILCLSVAACQKELSVESPGNTPGTGSGGSGGTGNNGSNASLNGTWNFKNMTVKTDVTAVTDAGGIEFKIITRTNYTTRQNTGTMSFNGTNAQTKNFGYSIDTFATTITYVDNMLFDSTDVPLVLPYFSSSTSTTYKSIGNDSLYFNSGFIDMSGSGSTTATQGSGAKYKIVGNELTMTFSIKRDTTIIDQGDAVRMRQLADGIIVFTK